MKAGKIIRIVFLLLLTGVTAMIGFSPFGDKKGYSHKLLIHTIEINVPVDSLFRFLGNSANAGKWSVFVDHISTLNASEVNDGTPGSIRRCFKNKNEQGIQWDELIAAVEQDKRRKLTIFNMNGFPLKAQGLATEQLYEMLAPDKTKLSFTLFFNDNNPSIADRLKTYFGAYRVNEIYRKNLANIKSIMENGTRLYEYD